MAKKKRKTSKSPRKATATKPPAGAEKDSTPESSAYESVAEVFWKARKLRKGDNSKAISLIAEQRREGHDSIVLDALTAELEERYDDAAALLETVPNDSEDLGLALYLNGSVSANRRKDDKAIEFFEKALAEPSFDARGNVYHNLGLAYADKKHYDKAINFYEKALAEPSYDTPGQAYIILGAAYAHKQEYDKAIECYEKALAEPSYDTPAYAYNNLGLAYAEKKEYDKAIECYEKALAEPSYDTPGSTYNNLGNSYTDKKEYDKAIECYEKALAEPSQDSLGGTCNNLGNVYTKKLEFDKAIECYQRSLEFDDDLARSNFLLGHALSTKEPQRAREYFKVAKEFYLKEGDRSSADLMDSLLIELNPAAARKESDIQDEAAIVKAVSSSATVESRMFAKLEQAEVDSYQKYADEKSTTVPYMVATLRGWSSTVPLLQSEVRGGGYFLKWNGFGLVIDPGHQFLQNFFEAGFHIRDVDSVLVTHNHGDHNQDLKPLDDLLYEMNKRDTANGYRYSLLWDADSESHVAFEPFESPHRRKLKYDFDRVEQGIEDAIRIRQPKEAPFEVRYFKAKHSPDVPNAVGVRITFKDEDYGEFTLGFSGDTSYFDDLCSENKLGNCDLLIAHISQPDSTELVDAEAELKKYHLGYRGTAKLIQGASPKLTVIGEFWAGLADLRIDLINGLRSLCKTNAIIPSSRSLRLDPRDLTIQCTSCQTFKHHSHILVAPAQVAFGPLSYICDECRIP